MKIILVKNKRNPKGYWTKERCQEESLKYKTRSEFMRDHPGGYSYCKKNKIIDEICSHMNNKIIKSKGYWTKERCQEEALKYRMRSIFQKESISSYQISLNNKWLDEICSHMEIYRKPIWTKERCQEEALTYSNRSEKNHLLHMRDHAKKDG